MTKKEKDEYRGESQESSAVEMRQVPTGWQCSVCKHIFTKKGSFVRHIGTAFKLSEMDAAGGDGNGPQQGVAPIHIHNHIDVGM